MFANSPSLADIAAVTGNNRNNDGMFGGDGWWAIIIFALIFGWGWIWKWIWWLWK